MFCTFLCLTSQQSCEARIQRSMKPVNTEKTGRLCDGDFVFSPQMFLCTTCAYMDI